MNRSQSRWLAASVCCAVAFAGCADDQENVENTGVGGNSGSSADAGTTFDSSGGTAGTEDGSTDAGSSGAGGQPPDTGPDTGCREFHGCRSVGCPGQKICSTDPAHGCHPSSCFCGPDGQIGCTDDCGGGVCVDPPCVGCPLEMPEPGSDCSDYEAGKVCTYAQQTNHCDYFTGGTSSGRRFSTCSAEAGTPTWR